MSWKVNIGSTFEQFREPYIGQEVLQVHRRDLTRSLFLSTGFRKPIMCLDGAATLHEKPDFYTPLEISRQLGSKSPLYVIDVEDQSTKQWTLERWQRYYDTPAAARKIKGTYNVISLEFSHTPLQRFVDPPEIVSNWLDWIQYWPKELRGPPSDSAAPKILPTTPLAVGVAGKTKEELTYPKIQYYCLMGVQKCFTDFHIDFGGSSVWYHVVKGRKDFLMIPPTKANLAAYEKWSTSDSQDSTFLPTMLANPDDCFLCTVLPGQTFFIPTGWIHAVYTPKDSMVFGGNFLHSYSIKLQTEVFEVEQRINVPFKFRFPFYGRSYWYLLDHYVKMILEHDKLGSEPPISDWEQEGLVCLVDWLPQWKFLAPDAMKGPENLWMPQYLLDIVEWWLRKGSKSSFPKPDPATYIAANFESVMSLSPIVKPICFCNANSSVNENENEFLIGCEFCGSWFHPHCVGMASIEEANESKVFYCNECIQRNFSPDSADAKARVMAHAFKPKATPPLPMNLDMSPASKLYETTPNTTQSCVLMPPSIIPRHAQQQPSIVTIPFPSASASPSSSSSSSSTPTTPSPPSTGYSSSSASVKPTNSSPPARAAPVPQPIPLLTRITNMMMTPDGQAPKLNAANAPSAPPKIAPGAVSLRALELPPRMIAAKRPEAPLPTESLQQSMQNDPKRIKVESHAPVMPQSTPNPYFDLWQQQALLYGAAGGYYGGPGTISMHQQQYYPNAFSTGQMQALQHYYAQQSAAAAGSLPQQPGMSQAPFIHPDMMKAQQMNQLYAQQQQKELQSKYAAYNAPAAALQQPGAHQVPQQQQQHRHVNYPFAGDSILPKPS